MTRPPPLRSLPSKPPVQRVRSGYDAHSQSQQDASYQSQSAHSVYSLSQEGKSLSWEVPGCVWRSYVVLMSVWISDRGLVHVVIAATVLTVAALLYAEPR